MLQENAAKKLVSIDRCVSRVGACVDTQELCFVDIDIHGESRATFACTLQSSSHCFRLRLGTCSARIAVAGGARRPCRARRFSRRESSR